MNILMATNTFSPHVGGVARSVEAFTSEFRRWGHCVWVVAPFFEGAPKKELGVIRVPAIQHFNGSDFSVRLPIPSFLFPSLERYHPDIVHAHHPFLLGDTALRIAAVRDVPLIFTHHTMYEQYTHYVPGDSPTLKRFVIELSTGFANLCDAVIAPSDSIAATLKERGVKTPIAVIPTGVHVERFRQGEGERFRRLNKIPPEAFVVGHVGRLAPEKNLDFLSKSVADFLSKYDQAHFIIAGTGPSKIDIQRFFESRNLSQRVHLFGVLQAKDLVDAYHAMDSFAFTSKTETQGMVLTEALGAGIPVVAVDAPGVREVLRDGANGRLLPKEDIRLFSDALGEIKGLSQEKRKNFQEEARRTAQQFSIGETAKKTLGLYESLIDKGRVHKKLEGSLWQSAMHVIEAEWEVWNNRAHAARIALSQKG
ncbi:MAG TPA: glycosyltransferase [Nitrospiria bacterium]